MKSDLLRSEEIDVLKEWKDCFSEIESLIKKEERKILVQEIKNKEKSGSFDQVRELLEKFNLPSSVVDSKWLRAHKSFDKNGIYICSYEFANRNVQKLSAGWDLMILDEAHKLRNFYNNKKP